MFMSIIIIVAKKYKECLVRRSNIVIQRSAPFQNKTHLMYITERIVVFNFGLIFHKMFIK